LHPALGSPIQVWNHLKADVKQSLHDAVLPTKHRQIVIRSNCVFPQHGKCRTSNSGQASGEKLRSEYSRICIPEKFQSAISGIQDAKNNSFSLTPQLSPELLGIFEPR